MEPFTSLTSHLVPLIHCDVDTDQIIPASYLKVTSKDGLVDGLFASWRYAADGSPVPEFPLNWAVCQGSQVLLAGDNFGTGSSREHAPWALTGWGFRAVISTSFADIFRNNSLKNGLLPVIVDEATHEELFEMVTADPTVEVTIDLAEQRLTLPDGRSVEFPIDAFSKVCLLEGVDQLGYLLKIEPQISDYERSREMAPAGEAA